MGKLNIATYNFATVTVRFLTRRYIGEYSSHTDMVYAHSSTVDHRPAHLNLLDATTTQDVEQVVSRHLQWAHAFVVVYDVTNRASFTHARHLLHAIHYHQATTTTTSHTPSSPSSSSSITQSHHHHFPSRLDVLSPPPLSPSSSPFCGIKSDFSCSSTSQDSNSSSSSSSSMPSSPTCSSHDGGDELGGSGSGGGGGLNSSYTQQYKTRHQRSSSFTPSEVLNYSDSSRHLCLSQPGQLNNKKQQQQQQNSREEVIESEAAWYNDSQMNTHPHSYSHHTLGQNHLSLGQGEGQERGQEKKHNNERSDIYVSSSDDSNHVTNTHLHHQNAHHLKMHTPHHKHSPNSTSHSPDTSHFTSHPSDTLHFNSHQSDTLHSTRHLISHPPVSPSLPSHSKHSFTYSQQARRYTTLLLANKRDLEHCRVVWTDEGEALSLQYSCQFYEVSAAESLLGVHLAFHSLLKEARAQQYISSLPQSPVTCRTSSPKGVVSSAVSKNNGLNWQVALYSSSYQYYDKKTPQVSVVRVICIEDEIRNKAKRSSTSLQRN
ncbi:hypothetical protein Pcinc_031244 [Petrolisthes cinctipes]|uniref:small monomeric GTPase n=1 Tax=Petrolisthes cinctipes TaxID=88211 RepID=A0AAE1EX14_PETCI|nr:hypothetical protein Pcinc_031244 [Petrolisthes cinctipes]